LSVRKSDKGKTANDLTFTPSLIISKNPIFIFMLHKINVKTVLDILQGGVRKDPRKHASNIPPFGPFFHLPNQHAKIHNYFLARTGKRTSRFTTFGLAGKRQVSIAFLCIVHILAQKSGCGLPVIQQRLLQHAFFGQHLILPESSSEVYAIFSLVCWTIFQMVGHQHPRCH
jgi:hypothetical protein